MKLDDNYSLYATPECWVLEYKKVTDRVSEKTGELIIKMSMTYHSDFHQGLKYYVSKCLEPSETIQEVLKILSRLEEQIDKLKLN